jgi:hypothetical protein
MSLLLTAAVLSMKTVLVSVSMVLLSISGIQMSQMQGGITVAQSVGDTIGDCRTFICLNLRVDTLIVVTA